METSWRNRFLSTNCNCQKIIFFGPIKLYLPDGELIEQVQQMYCVQQIAFGSLVWQDLNPHSLASEIFKIFQFVGFDGRQPTCSLPHLNIKENFKMTGATQFHIDNFVWNKVNYAGNTWRIFKEFAAVSGKIAMWNLCRFESCHTNYSFWLYQEGRFLHDYYWYIFRLFGCRQNHTY